MTTTDEIMRLADEYAFCMPGSGCSNEARTALQAAVEMLCVQVRQAENEALPDPVEVNEHRHKIIKALAKIVNLPCIDGTAKKDVDIIRREPVMREVIVIRDAAYALASVAGQAARWKDAIAKDAAEAENETLTDEQITQEICPAWAWLELDDAQRIEFARAIEAAHGIGVKENK